MKKARKKEVIVISLGGSQIIVDGYINVGFLREFRRVLKSHSGRYKFVVVCGGGSVARMYISGLKEIGASVKLQSYSGISATRTNARFMNYFFGYDNPEGIPHKMDELKEMLVKRNVVFTGALEYKPNQTSDSTAAEIAKEFESNFINITNVDGLFDKNPKEYKSAKFIGEITWKEFDKMASKIKFKPGQHFVLDQKAAKLIKKNKTMTYIIGNELKNLDKILSLQDFKGTLIYG